MSLYKNTLALLLLVVASALGEERPRKQNEPKTEAVPVVNRLRPNQTISGNGAAVGSGCVGFIYGTVPRDFKALTWEDFHGVDQGLHTIDLVGNDPAFRVISDKPDPPGPWRVSRTWLGWPSTANRKFTSLTLRVLLAFEGMYSQWDVSGDGGASWNTAAVLTDRNGLQELSYALSPSQDLSKLQVRSCISSLDPDHKALQFIMDLSVEGRCTNCAVAPIRDLKATRAADGESVALSWTNTGAGRPVYVESCEDNVPDAIATRSGCSSTHNVRDELDAKATGYTVWATGGFTYGYRVCNGTPFDSYCSPVVHVPNPAPHDALSVMHPAHDEDTQGAAVGVGCAGKAESKTVVAGSQVAQLSTGKSVSVSVRGDGDGGVKKAGRKFYGWSVGPKGAAAEGDVLTIDQHCGGAYCQWDVSWDGGATWQQSVALTNESSDPVASNILRLVVSSDQLPQLQVRYCVSSVSDTGATDLLVNDIRIDHEYDTRIPK